MAILKMWSLANNTIQSHHYMYSKVNLKTL